MCKHLGACLCILVSEMSIPTQWVVAFKSIRQGCIFAHAILHTEQNILAMNPTQWCWTNKCKNTNVFGTKFRSADKNRMVPLSKAFRILQRTILWIALMSCSFHTFRTSWFERLIHVHLSRKNGKCNRSLLSKNLILILSIERLRD